MTRRGTVPPREAILKGGGVQRAAVRSVNQHHSSLDLMLMSPRLPLTDAHGHLQAERFDAFADLPHYPFPGGQLFQVPFSALGAWYYTLRDKLGV